MTCVTALAEWLLPKWYVALVCLCLSMLVLFPSLLVLTLEILYDCPLRA
jgi:hypothetical protein